MRLNSLIPLLSLGLVLGCGDKDPVDSIPGDDSGVDDSGAEADADADADADTDTDTDADSDPEGITTAAVATVSLDYSVGSFSTVGIEDGAVNDDLFVTSGDPGVVAQGGLIFQFNSGNDNNLRAYEPGSWSEPLWEVSLGSGANPNDVQVCANKVFVALYDRDYVGIYDITTGTLSGQVDLSAFNDGDGVGPEPSSLTEINGLLYVGLNRLDRNNSWVNAGGKVVEVDCATEAVARDWDIAGNARIYDVPGSEKVLVGADAYGNAPGGLYELYPPDNSVELAVDFDAVGYTLVGLAVRGARAIAATAAQDYSHYAVQCVNFEDQSLQTLDNRTSFVTDVAFNPQGQAWVSWHWGWIEPENNEAGISVYDIETCSPSANAWVPMTLAPYAVDFY